MVLNLLNIIVSLKVIHLNGNKQEEHVLAVKNKDVVQDINVLIVQKYIA